MPVTRIDGPIWQPGPAGGYGPPGWLGSAASAAASSYYAPLEDYQLSAPSLDPNVAARVQVIHGRQNILSGTSIATHTNILSSSKTRLFVDGDWFAVRGETDPAEMTESILTLFHPRFDDRRLATFAFWWASTAGSGDSALSEAMAFMAAHTLAQEGYLGLTTMTDDPAVVQQYTVQQPLVRAPWDMLVDLGLQNMLAL